jgi:hypothetical protein
LTSDLSGDPLGLSGDPLGLSTNDGRAAHQAAVESLLILNAHNQDFTDAFFSTYPDAFGTAARIGDI